MDIRSITLFCDPATSPADVATFLATAREAFPVKVQTIRLATTPFPDWFDSATPVRVNQQGSNFAERWRDIGVDYISLGPVQSSHSAIWIDALPHLLNATDVLFATAEIADATGQIDIARTRHIARTIQAISRLQANGFGNLYLAATANCRPGAPFFPVAYHRGGPTTFALAVESADLSLTAVKEAASLTDARANLVSAIETAAASLTEPALALADRFGIAYGGIDFSLAPFPTNDKSLGGTLEAFGLPHVGASGSLFAAAFVTEAIERANFPRCGFSGLMLPVLEDSVLADRAATGSLTLNDLLGYAAVCGVGLDTIPLPGDSSEAELTAVLLDVAALASRLHKPLTARLMPLPGLAAGDEVTFDFPYFADSRVMAISGSGASGLLTQPATIRLQSIQHR